MRYKHFTKDERNELSILLKKDYSQADIAIALGRNPSSISRELKLNSVNGIYDPNKAQHKAYVKRKYSKYQGMKVRGNLEIEAYIKEKIKLSWSPESIAGRLKLDTNGRLSIHHTVIYKYLYSSYGNHLCKYLRYKHYGRKRRKAVKSKREIIKNRVFINNRLKVINERRRFWDFEGDTLGYPKSGKESLAGLIERKSRYILVEKIKRLRYAVEGFKKLFNSLPITALSLTLDNGPENARYSELKVNTYFCHPYSAWEKGSIENAFGLIREYIPKKTKLENYTEDEINVIVNIINNRPRKCLGFRTPKEVFEEQFIKQRCCTSG